MLNRIRKCAYKKNAALGLAAIAWTILIFIGCSLPGRDLPKVNLWEHTDKLVHFIFFFIYFLLWIWYVPKSSSTPFIILASAIIYGFALEFYQIAFVAGRSFDVWDGISDSLGALVAWAWESKMWRQKTEK